MFFNKPCALVAAMSGHPVFACFMMLCNQVDNQEEIFRIEQEERRRRWQLETLKHFLPWAFGADYATLPDKYIVDTWNRRHGHRLYLPLTDDLEKSMERMVGLYAEMFCLN